jgi:hypothetical protein
MTAADAAVDPAAHPAEDDEVEEPPTEPLPEAAAIPESKRTTEREPEPEKQPFARTRFHFMSGMPGGETAHIRADGGEVLFAYRSFASIVPIVAALVSGIVTVAGLAAVAFLLAEKRVVYAILALMLSAAFAVIIAMLVPPIKVTLFSGLHPMVTVVQQSNLSFPVATYIVATPDGHTLSRIRRSVFSRLGRNRWHILAASDDRPIGAAIEESLVAALARKVAGKFDPRYEADLTIRYLGRHVGTIVRRPTAHGERDLLDVSTDEKATLDRRVAVALALLVLGAEP